MNDGINWWNIKKTNNNNNSRPYQYLIFFHSWQKPESCIFNVYLCVFHSLQDTQRLLLQSFMFIYVSKIWADPDTVKLEEAYFPEIMNIETGWMLTL